MLSRPTRSDCVSQSLPSVFSVFLGETTLGISSVTTSSTISAATDVSFMESMANISLLKVQKVQKSSPKKKFLKKQKQREF
eukprot:m.72935 g.72935  ORF g.72935 m.72935 type:complete len:81 (+) comp24497_c0_seq1:1438-1680(+)